MRYAINKQLKQKQQTKTQTPAASSCRQTVEGGEHEPPPFDQGYSVIMNANVLFSIDINVYYFFCVHLSIKRTELPSEDTVAGLGSHNKLYLYKRFSCKAIIRLE